MEDQCYCKTKQNNGEIIYTKFNKLGDEWEYSDFLVARKYKHCFYDNVMSARMPVSYAIRLWKTRTNK